MNKMKVGNEVTFLSGCTILYEDGTKGTMSRGDLAAFSDFVVGPDEGEWVEVFTHNEDGKPVSGIVPAGCVQIFEG